MTTRIYNSTTLPFSAIWMTLLILFSFNPNSSHARTLVAEGFDIASASTTLHNNRGAESFGWDGNWFSRIDLLNDSSGIYQGVSHQINAEPLSYGGIQGYGGSLQIHNVMSQTSDPGFWIGDVTRNYRDLDRTFDSGVLWIGFLAKPVIHRESSGGDNAALIGFFQLVFTSKNSSDWTNLSNGDGRLLGVGIHTWGDSHWAAGGHVASHTVSSNVDMEDGEVAFLVLRVNFDELEVDFWINPDPNAMEPGQPEGSFSIMEGLRISRVAVFDGSHNDSHGNVADFSGTRFDQIYFGTSYPTVTPKSDPVLNVWNGFPIIANWVDTGDWLGWLQIANSPWNYSPSVGWLYMPEPQSDGTWLFRPKPE